MTAETPEKPLDLLVHPSWIVPVEPAKTVLSDHSLGVTDGVITLIEPTPAARSRRAAQTVDLPGHALMPGLINCHGHAAMSLLRGVADDLPLMRWLRDTIWPLEAKFVSEDFVRDGANLALAELIRGGITCFSDQYFYPDMTAQCADLAGIRTQIGFPIIDVETAWSRDAEECLARGLTLRDQYRDHELIDIGFGPHSNYAVAEDVLMRVATLANELDAPVQIHLHETTAEVAQFQERTGERPLAQLARIGLLGPRTQCVHMTALAEEDYALLEQSNAHVIHCPRSNMKLASGISPVNTLLDRGINVALGTDGAASNNRLSLFAEMQAAALIAKIEAGDASALGAVEVLEMATLGGARALGYDNRIGSLSPGKDADMIAVDLSDVGLQPLHNVISQLVYATSGTEVRYSWVAGSPLLEAGKPTRIDLDAVTTRATYWQQRIASEAGGSGSIRPPTEDGS